MKTVGMTETRAADEVVDRIMAISVKQPWASMIAQGRKTIETRPWPTARRGSLLIVSCKKPVIPGCPIGQALCTCALVDCRVMTEMDEQEAHCEVYPNAWAWLLENVQEIQPFPVRGQQGFYWVELKR